LKGDPPGMNNRGRGQGGEDRKFTRKVQKTKNRKPGEGRRGPKILPQGRVSTEGGGKKKTTPPLEYFPGKGGEKKANELGGGDLSDTQTKTKKVEILSKARGNQGRGA